MWEVQDAHAGSELGSVLPCVAVLSDSSALVTGSFAGGATFGPDESGETKLTSAGNLDIFLAR